MTRKRKTTIFYKQVFDFFYEIIFNYEYMFEYLKDSFFIKDLMIKAMI